MNYVTASLHANTFYLEQDNVLRIAHDQTVTKVPFAPPWIVGIVPYGEEPIPVIDGFAPEAEAARLQILYSLDGQIIAYQADSIGELCHVEEENLMPLVTRGSRYLQRIKVWNREMQV